MNNASSLPLDPPLLGSQCRAPRPRRPSAGSATCAFARARVSRLAGGVEVARARRAGRAARSIPRRCCESTRRNSRDAESRRSASFATSRRSDSSPAPTGRQHRPRSPTRLPEHRRDLVAYADALLKRQFDLLSYRTLWFGDPIDWHLDPLRSRRAPLVAVEPARRRRRCESLATAGSSGN